MSVVVGIDPGATGWAVAVDSDGIAWARPLPDSPAWLADLLNGLEGVGHILVERQHPIRGQGLASTFTIGRRYGEILGVLAALSIPHDLVRAQDWQAAMLRGEAKAKGKELKRLYVSVARRLWPREQFSGPRGGLLDGKAAAALIAEYGRRRLTGDTKPQGV